MLSCSFLLATVSPPLQILHTTPLHSTPAPTTNTTPRTYYSAYNDRTVLTPAQEAAQRCIHWRRVLPSLTSVCCFYECDYQHSDYCYCCYYYCDTTNACRRIPPLLLYHRLPTLLLLLLLRRTTLATAAPDYQRYYCSHCPHANYQCYELELTKNPVEGFSAGLVDDNNIYEWCVVRVECSLTTVSLDPALSLTHPPPPTPPPHSPAPRREIMIIGPPETYYEGGFFKTLLTFPKEYPQVRHESLEISLTRFPLLPLAYRCRQK